jgi:hypothetical protein
MGGCFDVLGKTKIKDYNIPAHPDRKTILIAFFIPS